jgi:hypothetical protein
VRALMTKKNDKNTPGFMVWTVMFTIFYPFIAVFSFVMTTLVWLFSLPSKAGFWLAQKIRRRAGYRDDD